MDVTISKSGILWCFVLIIACVLLGNGLSNQSRLWEAMDLAELNATNWEYGDYVRGDITTFIKDSDNRGCSGTYDAFHEYTIPVNEGNTLSSTPALKIPKSCWMMPVTRTAFPFLSSVF